MKTRVLIVDDEPLAREKIRGLLDEQDRFELLEECENGVIAVQRIKIDKPDLIFLDVQMPEMDGFTVLEALHADELPAVIFVTAYDSYALRAFEVHAVDYLLKPFDRSRFNIALERAVKQITQTTAESINRKLLDLLEDLRSGKTQTAKTYLERLVIKSVGRVVFLNVDEIDWIEAAGNYVHLHVGKESHLFRSTMNRLVARLDANQFIRIHRSTIVRIDRIKEMELYGQAEYCLKLRSGQRLISSRTYRHELNRLMARSQ